MSWFEALILGIVQGLTEFLPVSSSGHLQIGQELLDTSLGEDNLTFAIIVHAATVLSTLVVLWYEVVRLFKGTFLTKQWNDEKNYVTKIVISMIPVAIVGTFFEDDIERIFSGNLLIVGACLLLTACLLTFSEWYQKNRKIVGHEVTYRDAVIIGLAQAVAVLPGLSRSGTTIATGLICGVKKESVAQFSFLMVLIPILGKALLDFIKLLSTGFNTGLSMGAALVGFVAAFITGCFACRFMIEIVRRQRLVWFAVYCAIVGSVAIIATIC